MTARKLATALLLGTIAGGLAAVGGLGPARAVVAPQSIPVMVLGSYHMGNPGRDLHNARIDPVTTPAKQRELAELAKRLARFRPTVVAVEADSDAPDLADPGYARFTPADLTKTSNETVQIGYRVAALTGARVIAVDVSEQPGEPDYFPFGPVADWAKAHPAAGVELAAKQAEVERFTQALTRDQARLTVTQVLARMNGTGPDGQIAMHRDFHNALYAFGDRHDQPGAELNGRWFTRNAKIFAKIVQATRPGDRVLVVYGAGHLYWLTQLATETPGYRNVPAGSVLGGR